MKAGFSWLLCFALEISALSELSHSTSRACGWVYLTAPWQCPLDGVLGLCSLGVGSWGRELPHGADTCGLGFLHANQPCSWIQFLHPGLWVQMHSLPCAGVPEPLTGRKSRGKGCCAHGRELRGCTTFWATRSGLFSEIKSDSQVKILVIHLYVCVESPVFNVCSPEQTPQMGWEVLCIYLPV